MSPVEISVKIKGQKQELQKLAATEIGMSNYRAVMRNYQQLLYNLMGVMEDFCELADKALNPLASTQNESQKES